MQKNETEIRPHFLADRKKLEKLEIILKSRGMTAFEYFPEEDKLILYDDNLQADKVIPGYAAHLKTSQMIHPDDRWKILDFFLGKLRGPIEVRTKTLEGNDKRRVLDALPVDENTGDLLVGYTRDITEQREREEILEEQARRDSMTMLYNHFWGKELIEGYLENKNPYDSCGLLVIDIDYFKNVNDTYGHLFGDRVLMELADILRETFDSQDILVRTGGDEFVAFLKNIDNKSLVKKVMQLIGRVRNCRFQENGYSISCSVGICFLPENVSGYTYDQLFENADWALYQAKLNGRDRYEFCDNLQRFKMVQEEGPARDVDIDVRYLNSDIVPTAFEIFEKTSSFDAAIELLLKVIGIRFRLDRITVIRTDLKDQNASRQYQWTSARAPEALNTGGSFTKEDFLTLFHSYDEYGTTVLQYDNMDMYSREAEELLMQGGAKTVLYAAMYCEGQYTGAISYVVCTDKRYWSKQSRSQIGELTKLISAHLAKNLAMNASHQGLNSALAYDSLTGLLSFTRFREEVERLILGQNAKSCVMAYGDFENFRYFNQKYGYHMGDYLLKEFSNFVIERMNLGAQSYFTRVVSDQFILCMPCTSTNQIAQKIQEINNEFVRLQKRRFPESELRIRTGIYFIPRDCQGVSAAIDAANYARKQIRMGSGATVEVYSEKLREKQLLDNQIINGIDEAITQRQFKIYLQPKVSLTDGSIVGAEAQVRWHRKDGSILYPASFIPLYEQNGRVTDLDLYMFEQVVEFLQKNQRLGRKQVPISINASALLASNPDTAASYLEILHQYGVDPGLTDIELLETEAVADYDNVKKLFQTFRKAGMKTSLDDFGAGYSMVNILVDIPVDTVKLDRTLIERCDDNPRGFYLLQQIITLIKGLGYDVLCEGVENERQVEILKSTGCEKVQGYLFYKPMTMEDYEKLMYGE